MKKSSSGRITVAQMVVNLDVGGLERVVLNLLEHGDRGRFRPVLICLRDGGPLIDDMRCDDVPVYRLGKKDRLDYGLFYRLAQVLRKESVNVLHCHNSGPLVYGTIAGRLTGTRVVYTAHGRYSASRLNKPLFRRFGLVDHVVGVSADSSRIAVESGGFPADRVETLINGIDTSRFADPLERAVVRSQLDIDAEVPVFGIVARLTAVKDHEGLFRAFALVLERHPRARLLVIGDGELRARLERTVGDLQLDGSVQMLGDRRDISDLLGACDAFVLSSYSEGLSITLLEAMAAGLPVVATDVGGNPEAVAADETGLIVPARDPQALCEGMCRMIENPDEARAMGERGRKRVREKFGVEAMVSRYEDIYENVAG